MSNDIGEQTAPEALEIGTTLKNPHGHSRLWTSYFEPKSNKILIAGYVYEDDSDQERWTYKIDNITIEKSQVNIDFFLSRQMEQYGLINHQSYLAIIDLPAELDKSKLSDKKFSIEILGLDKSTRIIISNEIAEKAAPEMISLISGVVSDNLTLKEKYLEVIKDFNISIFEIFSSKPHTEASNKFQLHIDFQIATPEGLFFFGWYAFLVNTEFKFHLCSKTDMVKFDFDQILFDRADVSKHLSSANLNNLNAKPGFVSFIRSPFGQKRSSYEGILIEIGEGNFYAAPLNPIVVETKKDLLKYREEIFGSVHIYKGEVKENYDKVYGPLWKQFDADSDKVASKIETLTFNSEKKNPKVSIIIPLYGRFDYVMHQLSSFNKEKFITNECEVIFVLDQPEKTFDMVLEITTQSSFYTNCSVKAVFCNENLGYAGANNLGADQANGEYLLLLNSDVFPKTDGWLRKLMGFLENDTSIGAIGPTLLYEDGSLQHGGMIVNKGKYPLNDFYWNEHPNKVLPYTFVRNEENFDRPIPMYGITGACFLVAKKTYEQVGGFDEGYIYGDFEDSDLCLKIQELGLTTSYLENCYLYHLERKSQNLFGNLDTKFKFTLYNNWKHTNKWHKQLAEWYNKTEKKK
jgi:GT2 family glycosyltransferase